MRSKNLKYFNPDSINMCIQPTANPRRSTGIPADLWISKYVTIIYLKMYFFALNLSSVRLNCFLYKTINFTSKIRNKVFSNASKKLLYPVCCLRKETQWGVSWCFGVCVYVWMCPNKFEHWTYKSFLCKKAGRFQTIIFRITSVINLWKQFKLLRSVQLSN